MCPDYEILSAYMDGEIENPWKEKIKTHLQECSACREKLSAFQNLHTMLQEDTEPDYNPSMYRVKERLESSPWALKKKTLPFWKKRLLIPVPIAAIAATVLICLGTVISVTVANLNPAKTNGTAVVVEKKTTQEDELATIIKLMENTDFNNEVTIQLPTVSRFSISGEPQFIRAKDINRSK